MNEISRNIRVDVCVLWDVGGEPLKWAFCGALMSTKLTQLTSVRAQTWCNSTNLPSETYAAFLFDLKASLLYLRFISVKSLQDSLLTA